MKSLAESRPPWRWRALLVALLGLRAAPATAEEPQPEPAAALPTPAEATSVLGQALTDHVTASVEIATKYVQRGMTDIADNEGLSLQPNLDVELPLGLAFNYWGASTDYPGPQASIAAAQSGKYAVQVTPYRHAFENDFTLWWTFKVGAWRVYLGGQYMYFFHATANNTPEGNLYVDGEPTWNGHALGKFNLTVEYMVKKTPWTNPNDAYVLLEYAYELDKRWALSWRLGTYLYGKAEDNLATVSTFNFRHLDLQVERKLDSGFRLRGAYIFGGYDRMATRLPNTMVWFVGHDF